MPHQIMPALLDKATPIDQLHPHPDNARTRSAKAKRMIRESLEDNGQYKTVVARRLPDGRLELMLGHGTVDEARTLGWTHVAADIHDDVDDTRARKIVAVDNRSSDLAGYDDDLLARLLAPLEADLRGSGYETSDYDELLANIQTRAGRAALTDVDAAPPPPATPHTRRGQVWIFGDHRLAIGDGTDPAVVRAALGGQRADLYLTDPPYGVSYQSNLTPEEARRTKRRLDGLEVGNDTLADDGDLKAFLDALFSTAYEQCHPGAPAYVFHSDTKGLTFRHAFIDAGWDLKQVLIWVKQTFTLGRQDHHWQHEPILYGWHPGAPHAWYGGRTLTTLLDDELDLDDLKAPELRAMLAELREEATALRHDRPARSTMHPTMKPVALLVKLMERSSRPGGLVLDTCAGAGSTAIAGHTSGRRTALVELDPVYGDVICRRFEEHTGIVPVLEETGQARSFT